MDQRFDAIIVGRGLAGIVLSETLRCLGKRVLIFDVPKPYSATQAAAGVVNPVAMRRAATSWRAVEMMPLAERFYRDLEVRSATRLWHPTPMVRLFANTKEADDWHTKKRDPVTGSFLEEGVEEGFPDDRFHAEHGYGRIPGCAWIDMPELLRTHREQWLAMGALVQREVHAEDVAEGEGLVQVHGASAPWLIWCNGAFAEWPGLVPTRGDVLSFTDASLHCNVMVHRSGFLLPVGDHRYKVGSTFAWTDVWGGTTESAKEELMRKASAMIRTTPPGPFQLQCGVRPATRDRRPVLGQVAPHQAALNGLGSRGALLAPWCAEHLAAHLFVGIPLDPDVDIARFR